jgi:drug/metabolite transporter (DMT)-like permease
MITVALLFIASLANAISQVLLKIGVTRLNLSGCGLMTAVIRLASSAHIWTGLILFCLSLGIYIFLLSHNELSLIFPAMGATYLFVVAIAALILNERVDFWRLSGSGMIAAGLALLAIANE